MLRELRAISGRVIDPHDAEYDAAPTISLGGFDPRPAAIARPVRAAYPESTMRRLASVKARYDPTNVFRRNHNIPPRTA